MKDISLHILDIAENSIRANASLVNILMTVDETKDELVVIIQDNGCGMSKEILDHVKSPFTTSRTTRNVGLGIPLFCASCENTGGSLDVRSEPGKGTTLTARYRYAHIDRPPFGDIAETVCTLCVMNPQIDIVFSCRKNDTFVYDTRDIKTTLDGLPITHPEVIKFLRDYLNEGIIQVFGGIDT